MEVFLRYILIRRFEYKLHSEFYKKVIMKIKILFFLMGIVSVAFSPVISNLAKRNLKSSFQAFIMPMRIVLSIINRD